MVKRSEGPIAARIVARRPTVEVLDNEMVQVLSAKTGGERIAIAAGMFRSARRMIISHLRQEHPDWDAARLQDEVIRRLSHGTG
jgi:hypothetical protein